MSKTHSRAKLGDVRALTGEKAADQDPGAGHAQAVLPPSWQRPGDAAWCDT